MTGWGRDKRRQALAHKLELANVALSESRALIAEIFEKRDAETLMNRAYRIQEQIRELKGLLKS